MITGTLLTQIKIILTLCLVAVVASPNDGFHLTTIAFIIFMNVIFGFQVMFILNQVECIFGVDVIVGGIVGVRHL